MSQQELASKLGVSQQLVSYWETEQREPNEDSQALLNELRLALTPLAEFEREMLIRSHVRCAKQKTGAFANRRAGDADDNGSQPLLFAVIEVK